jgi:uncharacterized protein YndB with AHSA1/START domain
MTMSDREQYEPGPASGAEVRKGGEKSTLILVRELRQPPEMVWQALTDPAQLREWAPFVADGSLGKVGNTVQLTWAGRDAHETVTVTRADAPSVLEYGELKWKLEPLANGTRLTLWIDIDRRFVSWGASGWHICFDVLNHLLNGYPIGRIVGNEAMRFGFERLNAEYARQFGVAALETAAKFLARH